MVILKSDLNIGNNGYIEQKLKELIPDKRLYRYKLLLRELNRHDFDRLFLRTGKVTGDEWIQFYKDIVDKLIKIHIPNIYGKTVQIPQENLVILPEDDKKYMNVLVMDYVQDKLKVVGIKPASEFDSNELLCLLGRHPFVDTKGWTICKVDFGQLKGVIGVGQQTWVDRGGDFDGDSALIVLIKLPEKLHRELEPEVYETTYEINESITIPKSIKKAVVEVKLDTIEMPDFRFAYCKDNKCTVFPETISYLQNLENLTPAILMAINIATDFKIKWNANQLKNNTEMILQAVKEEIEIIKKKDRQSAKLLQQFIDAIHPTFMQILTPLVFIENDIDIELYQAVLRIFLKDKGPSKFGALQKRLLSVAETKEEIRRVLDFIAEKQQAIIDLKKAEHPITAFNEALNATRKEYLENSEVADLYIKWRNIDANWSKNKYKLLFYEIENDIVDKLVSVVRRTFLKP